jgi:hypothetical protein
MTLYIVRAKPKNDLPGLRKELESGKIMKLRPFGETLHHGLLNARFDSNNSYAMWVEQDYCSPPLAMERESVLDKYFRWAVDYEQNISYRIKSSNCVRIVRGPIQTVSPHGWKGKHFVH